MWAVPWVCRRCVRSLNSSISAQLIRKASTDSHATLPRALLERARKLVTEHDQLNSALQSNFDAKTAKRVGELSSVASALREWETARSSIAELGSLVKSTDPELRALAEDELESTTEALGKLGHRLSTTLTPKHPFADMPCLIEIRPGPGGKEGQIFTDEVFRMYRQYCANKGFRANVVKYEAADETGGEAAVAEAVLEVQDPGAYGHFRSEAGMHRVQRVPATEKSGRTHTSAVAVWVLPSFPEANAGAAEGRTPEEEWADPESDFYIRPEDVRTETMRARGAGGQHVNKTESAIRLTHAPTGTVVSMQDSRSQHRNRENAWRLLRARVAQLRREERELAVSSVRNSVLSKDRITRGDKIRTYNYGQDRCTDHRSGLDVHNLPNVLEGGDRLGRIMDSVQDWLLEKDIQGVIAEEEAASADAAEEGKRGKR